MVGEIYWNEIFVALNCQSSMAVGVVVPKSNQNKPENAT